MVIDDAEETALREVVRSLSKIGVVDEINLAAFDRMHHFRSLETEALQHESGFRRRITLSAGNSINAAGAVEIRGGQCRNDGIGIRILVA